MVQKKEGEKYYKENLLEYPKDLTVRNHGKLYQNCGNNL